MPRLRDSRLDNDQNYIIYLYLQKKIPIENIRYVLCRRWSIKITNVPSVNTIRTRLTEWGINLDIEGHGGHEARVDRQKDVSSESLAADEVLVAQIRSLIKQGLDGVKILNILRSEGWPDLTESGFKHVRHAHGIVLRTPAIHKEAMAAEARAIVAEGLESGITADFGDNMSVAWVKARADRFISGPAVKAAIRDIDPEGVEFRRRKQIRIRKELEAHGPGWMWSADAYDKLQPYGIQVYGIIDAYSRFMIKLFIGHDVHTSVAVQKYYLMAVALYGYPKLTRTDMGVETPLMVECQGQFREAGDKRNLSVGDYHIYGASVHNVRIEGWWSFLRRAQSGQWISLFEGYHQKGWFRKKNRWDIRALQYVYMPIVRKAFRETQEAWNAHTIRSQRNRPYLPTGKPVYLWRSSNAPNYLKKPDKQLLQRLQDEVQSWDHERYLTSEVEVFCYNTLVQNGLPGIIESASARDDTHTIAYLLLREHLERYERRHGFFEDIRSPEGSHEWIARDKERRSGLQNEIEMERRMMLQADYRMRDHVIQE